MANCGIRSYETLVATITPCRGSTGSRVITNQPFTVLGISMLDYKTKDIVPEVGGILALQSNTPQIHLTVNMPEDIKGFDIQQPSYWKISLEREDGKTLVHPQLFGKGDPFTSNSEEYVNLVLLAKNSIPFTEIMPT